MTGWYEVAVAQLAERRTRIDHDVFLFSLFDLGVTVNIILNE